jgi:predicted nucleic acid-binding protein
LEILREAASEVVVPLAVLSELEAHGVDDTTVTELRRHGWIRVIPAPEIHPSVAAWDLGPGESSVLSMALADPGSWAVLDDGRARRCARGLRIPVIGTLGLILLAKGLGRIPLARPVIDRLKVSGMYLSDEVIDQVLKRAGE